MRGGKLTGMSAELVSIPTDDRSLDGLLYEPAGTRADWCVQFFHGNAMNFYVGPARFLPPALLRAGFACLTYNRRGHDTLSTYNSREPEGNAFQTADQAVADNEYARRWLAERGYADPIAVGHSNGGLLATYYAAHHPRTPALVLLSAHCGGTGLAAVASRYGLLARDRLEEVIAEAKSLVAQGRGQQLMLLPGWWHVTSAESFVDLLAHTPDLLQLAPRVASPTLYLRGESEPRELYPMEEFQHLSKGHCETRVMIGSDHFYNGAEEATADLIANWLSSTLRV